MNNAGSVPPPKPTVVILCGGRGTRLQEHSPALPKPLIEIGGRPILWHVINMYLAHGFGRFLLLTGYRGEQLEAFVAATGWPRDARIDCLDTGADTPTGGRLLQAAPLLDEDRFCLAYADGVADIDLGSLLAFHRDHARQATMAVVQPQLPFGVARLDRDGSVLGFTEKPRSELWVNAGFFCFERGDVRRAGTRQRARARAARAPGGGRRAARLPPRGFWECMDTYKDWLTLNDLWSEGRAPWKASPDRDPAG